MIKINLLKPEKKEVAAGGTTISITEEAKPSQLSLPALIGAIVLTVCGIGLLYFLQSSELASEKKLFDDRTLRKAELEKVLKELAEIETTKLELDNKIKIISDLKLQQKDAVFMMDKMSRSLPEWVWLTNLDFKGGAVSISGKALSNNLIADLINNLQNSNSFANVQLKSTTRKREAGIDIFEFRIECQFIHQSDLNKVV
ncbi:MAG: PilN domain-containing protein [Acidobacteria bacterium]|nr:PilN domain-containing protein [Acidobacteriota bacterium]MBU4307404.1 PilN domain-containing protein [Acidobacteriota bacterium]MCG2811605.1 PilN domain-containing protein [Candidatus Aminicenantes bacterium]